jgi:phospholipase C
MVYDHTSVLKMIEWRWGLSPLTPRDGSSDINNLAYALDFTQSQTAVPSLPKPVAPAIGVPCVQNPVGIFEASGINSGAATPASDETATWKAMYDLAARNGFQVK